MALAIPLVNTEGITTSQRAGSARSSSVTAPFEPAHVDLVGSQLKDRTINLIVNGDGIDKYNGDESAAVFAVCLAMAAVGFSDQKIASVLTDKTNHLGLVAYRHTKSTSRTKAARWILEHSLKKARAIIEQENGFSREAVISESDSNARDRPPPDQKLSLTFERFKDIALDTTSPALIQDLIDHNALCVVYGESNSGKTFFMIDLAIHVALGREWQGRKVDGGAVLYVAAEGGRRIKDRIIAYRKFHQLEEKAVPFLLARGSINLFNSRTDTQALVEEIKETARMFVQPIRLVVIDTLSRALSGGDENASTDMGAFIRNVDRIRTETGTTVAVVHHSGKDRTKGARGHSLLRAAIDTELEIADHSKAPGIKIAKTTKQRDYDYGREITFRLEPVEIGKSDDGRTISSCVVRPENLDAVGAFAGGVIKPDSVAGMALRVLQNLIKNTGVTAPTQLGLSPEAKVVALTEWRKEFLTHYYHGKKRQTQSSAFLGAKRKLSESQRIKEEDGYVWVLE